MISRSKELATTFFNYNTELLRFDHVAILALDNVHHVIHPMRLPHRQLNWLSMIVKPQSSDVDELVIMRGWLGNLVVSIPHMYHCFTNIVLARYELVMNFLRYIIIIIYYFPLEHISNKKATPPAEIMPLKIDMQEIDIQVNTCYIFHNYAPYLSLKAYRWILSWENYSLSH